MASSSPSPARASRSFAATVVPQSEAGLLRAALRWPCCPGRLFIADTRNHRIRVVDLASGLIDTLAGTGERAKSAEGAAGKAAHLNGPFAVDAREGRLYVADLMNRRIAQIDAGSGAVHTLAGNGEKGVPEDGARASEAPLVDPRAAAIDRRGNVYVLERQGNALRVVNVQGQIRTLIGPDHPEIHLNGPKHLAIDLDGDVIIADDQNHRIIEYNPDGGKWAILAGTGEAGRRVRGRRPACHPASPAAWRDGPPLGRHLHFGLEQRAGVASGPLMYELLNPRKMRRRAWSPNGLGNAYLLVAAAGGTQGETQSR